MEMKIDVKLLQQIAKYYEFPFAVFFTQSKHFPKCKTRRQALSRKAAAFDEVKEIVERQEVEKNDAGKVIKRRSEIVH